MRDVKTTLKPVPQPYKTWIARTLIVPMLAVAVPIAAVLDAFAWCKERYEEVTDMWREIRKW